jgi:hypothetical protein
MDFKNWVEQERGRAAALADFFCVGKAAITQWKTNGVPISRMKAVRDFSKGEVTLESMLPDTQQPAAQA